MFVLHLHSIRNTRYTNIQCESTTQKKSGFNSFWNRFDMNQIPQRFESFWESEKKGKNPHRKKSLIIWLHLFFFVNVVFQSFRHRIESVYQCLFIFFILQFENALHSRFHWKYNLTKCCRKKNGTYNAKIPHIQLDFLQTEFSIAFPKENVEMIVINKNSWKTNQIFGYQWIFGCIVGTILELLWIDSDLLFEIILQNQTFFKFK